MKEFCAPRAKTYAYLMDDDSKKKKAKGTRKCMIKRKIIFEDYKDSLFNNNTILRSPLRFKNDLHNVYTEDVNKIALNSNDDSKHSIELQDIHMEQTHLSYPKVK